VPLRQPVEVNADPVVHREEAVSTMFAITDILEEVREIRALLEGDDGQEEEPEDEGRT
jgi:hypothetical protein